MDLIEVQVTVTIPYVPNRVPVGNPTQKRARIFCKWVEFQTIDDHRSYLRKYDQLTMIPSPQ